MHMLYENKGGPIALAQYRRAKAANVRTSLSLHSVIVAKLRQRGQGRAHCY